MKKLILLALIIGLFGATTYSVASANGAETDRFVYDDPACSPAVGFTGQCSQRTGTVITTITPTGKFNQIWDVTTLSNQYVNGTLVSWVWVDSKRTYTAETNPPGPPTRSHGTTTRIFSNGCEVRENSTAANGVQKHYKRVDKNCD